MKHMRNVVRRMSLDERAWGVVARDRGIWQQFLRGTDLASQVICGAPAGPRYSAASVVLLLARVLV